MKLSSKDRQYVKEMIDNGWHEGHIKKFLLDDAKREVETMLNKYHYALDLHYEKAVKGMEEYYKEKYKE